MSDKIEVNSMTGMIDMLELSYGFEVGWGWTHWDGWEHGKLFAIYACNQDMPTKGAPKRFEVYIEGELHTTLAQGTDPKQWALDQGWRPVVFVTLTENK